MERLYTVVIKKICDLKRDKSGFIYIYDEYDKKTITCIKDDEYMVDIETNERYYLLGNNKELIPGMPEYKIVKFNVEYATSAQAFSYKKFKRNTILRNHLLAVKARYKLNQPQKQLKR